MRYLGKAYSNGHDEVVVKEEELNSLKSSGLSCSVEEALQCVPRNLGMLRHRTRSSVGRKNECTGSAVKSTRAKTHHVVAINCGGDDLGVRQQQCLLVCIVVRRLWPVLVSLWPVLVSTTGGVAGKCGCTVCIIMVLFGWVPSRWLGKSTTDFEVTH